MLPAVSTPVSVKKAPIDVHHKHIKEENVVYMSIDI